MKLITLNIWGGRINNKLEDFFKQNSSVDMWCFQEVFKSSTTATTKQMANVHGYEPNLNLFEDIHHHLPELQGEFCPTHQNDYGVAIFLRPDITILDKGDVLVAKGNWHENADPEIDDHDRKLQWVRMLVSGTPLLLANVHLTHRPQGKMDSEKRLKQSQSIIDFLSSSDDRKILVGDFNLLPDTESIRMIENSGMRNLVKEYGVESTRTKLYRRYENGPKFADYIFTSPDIVVNDFKVMPDEVSDHSPLMLDFEE
jgi:endonuclease/exonuclease/phosphatase family metal-dependent hydrolase